jgi:hypothetical protein
MMVIQPFTTKIVPENQADKNIVNVPVRQEKKGFTGLQVARETSSGFPSNYRIWRMVLFIPSATKRLVPSVVIPLGE